MSELLPCPFCGGSKVTYVIDKANDTNWYSIACESCGANAALDLGKSGAIDKWNTRARSSVEDERANIAAILARAAEADALRAERDELKRPLDEFVMLHELGSAVDVCPSVVRYGMKLENDIVALRATVAAQTHRIEAATYIINECENAIGDYVEKLEKRGDIMGYGRKVWALCKEWLAANAPTPTQGETEGEA